MKHLLIVESPTKAKKIAPMLGPGWSVRASVGHMRDLPKAGMNVARDGSYAGDPQFQVASPSHGRPHARGHEALDGGSYKPLLAQGETLWTDTAFADRVAGIRRVAVTSCEEGVSKSAPPAPFTTSTLQQAGSNRLKFGSKKTMAVAQRLFEAGLIT